ncbi:hypothetical protein ACFE04_020714 [Oxalis oulophora]
MRASPRILKMIPIEEAEVLRVEVEMTEKEEEAKKTYPSIVVSSSAPIKKAIHVAAIHLAEYDGSGGEPSEGEDVLVAAVMFNDGFWVYGAHVATEREKKRMLLARV